MYRVNGNKDANAHFAFFFQFFLLSLLYNTYMDDFRHSFLSNHLIKDCEILCTFSGRQSVLCK